MWSLATIVAGVVFFVKLGNAWKMKKGSDTVIQKLYTETLATDHVRGSQGVSEKWRPTIHT